MHPDTFNPLPTPADVERRRETERLLAEVERLRAEVRRLQLMINSEAERCESRLAELRAALRAVGSPAGDPADCPHPRSLRMFLRDDLERGWAYVSRCARCGMSMKHYPGIDLRMQS